MKRMPSYLFCLILMLQAVISRAELPVDGLVEASAAQSVLSLYSLQASWTFSGNVTNENNERYSYFLQIQRNNAQFHAIATLLDATSKGVLIYEESNTLIDQPELDHWQVGNIFLRFNPVNNSWVFGVKAKDKKGFNFKVDTLGLTKTQQPKQQNLRAGLELLISQTGQLNGHVQVDEKSTEQFVTAKKAWFRQIWVSKAQDDNHKLTSVLCEFNNGSALYSVNLPEEDAVRGTMAGWRDEQGKSLTMSQFLTIKEEKDNTWQLHISSPKTDLLIHNLIGNIDNSHQWIVGLTEGSLPGFCAINFDEIVNS